MFVAGLLCLTHYPLHLQDVNKVQKLVQGAYNQFMRVYLPMLTADQRLQIDGNNIRQDSSTRAIYHRLAHFSLVSGSVSA